MEISLATIEDATEIFQLQKLAYRSEGALYGDDNVLPLTEGLAETISDFHGKTILKAAADHHIWGSVRARSDGRACSIGRLIVHPEKQGKGIGTRLLAAIEDRFPEVERYELFTGAKSLGNLRLYHRLGYRPCKEMRINDRLTLVFLEKPGKT